MSIAQDTKLSVPNEQSTYSEFNFSSAPLVAQTVKRLSATRETWVQFLGREDPPEKEIVTHSSILAWRISWTEEPSGLHGIAESNTTE